MNFSLIIPTMNRPELLLRLIRYYHGLGFGGRILIGDSSEERVFMETAGKLNAYVDRLFVEHRYLPGHSVSEVVSILAEDVITDYVALLPDDDFLTPSGIEECISFLVSNPQYVAAHGIGVLVSSEGGDCRRIDGASYYPQPELDSGTAAERLIAHLAGYSVSLFSVHRVAVWKRMFSPVAKARRPRDVRDKSFVDELLPCCLSAVCGKIKQLDRLYLVRQVHEDRYLLPSWFDWISSEKWSPSYTYFRLCLAEEISTMDRISQEAAADVVDEAFANYLQKWISRHTVMSGSGFSSVRHTWLPKPVRIMMRKLRVIFVPAHISLNSLLTSSTRHNSDFMPVYASVTDGPDGGK
ncbi:MAG: TIGR00180 family glycosyltransferase [Sulfuritalea sp.]|nr:TIGR00180 family glycosyltransferase [Sulfuritalea sp.]